MKKTPIINRSSSNTTNRKEGDFVLEPSNTTDIDEVGFSLRLEGVNIRDCVVIQSPEGPSFVMVGQVPSNQTFLEQVVRGQGSVLDIDGSRVSTTETIQNHSLGSDSAKSKGIYGDSHAQKTHQTSGQKLGRFPTNLILKHGKDCYQEGTKKVKGIKGTAAGRMGGVTEGSNTYEKNWAGSDKAGSITGYASEEGTEEVPNWICEPSCPVRILDSQSGNRPGFSGGGQRSSNRVYGDMPSGEPSKTYGDQGGASRFFKQVTSEDELNTYLENLVRRG